MLLRNLGTVAGATGRGITLSSSTNATPIVATLGALHGVPSMAQNPVPCLRRYGIFGVTTQTACNGIWSLTSTGTNTFSLDGSAGNGAATVTNSVVTLINDQVPFMSGHAAVAFIGNAVDQVAADLTFTIQGNKLGNPAYGGQSAVDGATDAEIIAADSSTISTYFEDSTSDTSFVTPGPTNDGTTEMRNVRLRRWMFLNVSAWTAGGISGSLIV